MCLRIRCSTGVWYQFLDPMGWFVFSRCGWYGKQFEFLRIHLKQLLLHLIKTCWSQNNQHRVRNDLVCMRQVWGGGGLSNIQMGLHALVNNYVLRIQCVH